MMYQNQVTANKVKQPEQFIRSKAVRNWHQIHMSSKCNKCGFQSKKQLLSDTLFEYSISRFIEQYFYNSKLQSTETKCEHCPLRDHSRSFHMADGSTINFKFTLQETYNIDLLNLKQQNNTLLEVIKFCLEKKQRVEKLIELKGT